MPASTRVLVIGAGMRESSNREDITKFSDLVHVRLRRSTHRASTADGMLIFPEIWAASMADESYQHGAQVTVFEQDAALDARPRDWNFGIYCSSMDRVTTIG